MKRFFSVYQQYYVNKGKSGIDFLRDAVGYLNRRNEHDNQNKTVWALLLDWCKLIEVNEHTRY